MRCQHACHCLIALGLFSPMAAFAHPADAAFASFASGVAHPWLGLDHVVAMVLVGLWAMQLGGRARWACPLLFVCAMVAGSVLSGAMASTMSTVELLIALSVATLGTLVAFRARLPLSIASALLIVFAMSHGCAHGMEGAGGYAFTAGFAAATLSLHAVGALSAAAMMRWYRATALQALGACAAALGAVLIVG